ncbi:MAG TPA: hypothetical protein VF727_11730 [Allosphingosinicella sp.]
MARYFFQLYDRTGWSEDKEGRELADLAAARRQALKGARSIMGADVLRGEIDLTARIDVWDSDGRVVLNLPFADAVQLLMPDGGRVVRSGLSCRVAPAPKEE